VLKKAGIVVAVAAAGLLAVSPLAFAGGGGGDQVVSDQENNSDETHQGLVNVSDNNVNVPVQACGILNNVDAVQVLSNPAVGVLAPATTGDTTTTTCTQEGTSAGDTNSQTNTKD